MTTVNKSHQDFVAEDLSHVVLPMDWSELNKSSLLISGGSGFMGIWLTELLLYLIKTQQIDLKIYALATNFAFARKEAPHLYTQSKYVNIISDDVRSLHELPEDVEWIIHAAASPDLRVHSSQPIYSSQSIAAGTLSMLDCATRLPRLKGFLNVSSGYVNGYHTTKELISEKSFLGFDPTAFSAAYIEAKRYAESLCTLFRPWVASWAGE